MFEISGSIVDGRGHGRGEREAANWYELQWDYDRSRTYEEGEELFNLYQNLQATQMMGAFDRFGYDMRRAPRRQFSGLPPPSTAPGLGDGFPYATISPDGPDLKVIRLLQVLPGSDAGCIDCSLRTFSFPDCPAYSALSYVWGDPSNPLPISVNGQPFAAGRSLFAALWHIRNAGYASTYLWADAICINQSDNDEKSHVVQHMGAIFGRAHSVLAWLGRSLPSPLEGWEGDDLIEQLRTLGDMFWEEAPPRGQRQDDTVLAETLNKCLPAVMDMFRKPMYEGGFLVIPYDALCQREYWKRMWVLQEVYLAKELQFHIGPKVISLASMAGAFLLLQAFQRHVVTTMSRNEIRRTSKELYFFAFHVAPFPDMHRLVLYTTVYPRNIASLRIAMTNFCLKGDSSQGSHATDPRDMVYGLLGFAQEEERRRVRPDYRSSVATTYQTITRALILGGWTDLLAWAQPLNRRVKGLPSWVPDYSSTIYDAICSRWQAKSWLPKFSASGSSKLESGGAPSEPWGAEAVLSLAGFGVDTVRMVGSFSPRLSRRQLQVPSCDEPGAGIGPTAAPHDQILRFIEEVASLCREAEDIAPLPPPGIADGAARREAAWRVPVADQLSLNNDILRSPPGLSSLYEKALAALRLSVHHGVSVPCEARPYVETMLLHVGRRAFVTARGYVGLGPPDARPGDRVVVLYGFAAPYVLRPALSTSTSTSAFELVGEAYVHGIMDGELARLPVETEVFSLV